MATTVDVAHAYTALLRRGGFAAAGDRFWSSEISSIEPGDNGRGHTAEVTGSVAAKEKITRRLETQSIDDLTIDGPFVTGNQFALFMDMVITDRASGESRPFAEIAIFTVSDALITEERYFYD
jgi:hypothetical protein